jgi:hypothetical protein
VEQLNRSLLSAIAYLSASQLTDGEFQTQFCVQKRTDGDGPPVEEPVFDSSPFVTSLVLYSLQFASHLHPDVAGMIRRGCVFLESEMEPGGLWRYWSRKNEKRVMIPPDLDDTACIAHALKSNGFSVPDNAGLFYDSRDAKGAFYTWLYKPNSRRKWRLWLQTKGRAFSHQNKIWQVTSKDDVCAVVNANVVLYLGETPETGPAIQYLREVVLAASEDKNIVFYAHKLSLYYMLSRAVFSGVSSLAGIKRPLLERVGALQRPDGSFGDELLTGMGICSLLNLGAVQPELEGAVDFLLKTQRQDGSWRRIPAYGGPPVPTTFGSADLTTGICLEALARYESCVARLSGEACAA